MHPSLSLTVSDKSQAGEARRLAQAWTRDACGDHDLAARAALIVTELANNLALHAARGGSLILRKLEQEGRIGVEILSLDDGPGAANSSQWLRDGYSTAGTPGTGLGSVARGSHLFEIHSQPGVGTALLCHVWLQPPPPPREDGGGNGVGGSESRAPAGAVNLAKRGETVSGDSWCLREGENGKLRLIVADGLGHGPLAAEASRAALGVFSAKGWSALPALMAAMHAALRATRGAAVAVAEIDPGAGALRFVGVGNIAACVARPDATTSSFVSLNGIVGGARSPAIQEFSYPWPRGGVLILCSDGLKTQWQLGRYPGLLVRHPSLIAGVLYRDYNRGTDDTTVAVVRLRP